MNSSGLSMLPSPCMVTVRDEFSVKRYLKPMWNADWVKIPVLETMQRVVCATANRVFVGSPLCAQNSPVLPPIPSMLIDVSQAEIETIKLSI